MSWISVDQSLFGGKLRTFHKTLKCSRNEAVGILITLWLWAVDNANQDGEIPSADRADIAEILAPGVSPDLDPSEVVSQLIETGWIEESGDALYIHDWEEWRSNFNRMEAQRQSHAERTRRYRERHKEEPAPEPHEDPVKEDKPPEEPEKKKKASGYTADFEQFWAKYPNKKDKGEAFKKYKARVKDGFRTEDLILAAGNYAEECRRDGVDQRYIKHGKTFLSENLPFTDYIPRRQSTEIAQGGIPGDDNPFRRG